MLSKVISGGQIGVDRAALDAAIDLGIDYGGFIPKGRRALDGRVPAKYEKMVEIESDKYPDRTLQNVLEADATLVYIDGGATSMSRGTALTVRLCEEHNMPCIIAYAKKPFSVEQLANVSVLNCAGARGKKDGSDIYEDAYRFFLNVFEQLK